MYHAGVPPEINQGISLVSLQGYYMRPTVITDVSDDSKLMQEEIFGPVVCIVPFSTEEEVKASYSSVFNGWGEVRSIGPW